MVDLLVRDPLTKVAVSSAIRAVATATWPGTVCPVGVTPVQDHVECHEEAIKDLTMVIIRAREEVSM